MLLRCLGLLVISLVGFLPATLALLLLWHFDSLGEGGPLIVVLGVPALGWFVSRSIRIVQNHTSAIENGPEADLPPKYEKVMLDPPPYEILFVGKPQTMSFPKNASHDIDSNLPHVHCSNSSSSSTENASSKVFPARGVAGSAFQRQRETLMGRGRNLVSIPEEESTYEYDDPQEELGHTIERAAKESRIIVDSDDKRLLKFPGNIGHEVLDSDPDLPSYEDAIVSLSLQFQSGR